MEDNNFSALAVLALSSSKYVNKKYATIGDSLIYTVVIRNTGATEAFNVILTDLIPQGANFTDNSVVINGVPSIGENPFLGIELNTIAVGATTTIVMGATVVTVPYNNPLNNLAQIDYQYVDLTTTPNIQMNSIDTNSVVTTINTVIMTLSKSVNESILTTVGQTLTYNIFILNGGSVTAQNTVLIDTVPAGTIFVPNSIKVFGVTIPGTVEPPTGLSLGNIASNSYSCISFLVQVTTIPSTNQISNWALSKYTYTVDPIVPTTLAGSTLSNEVILSQSVANLSTTWKMVDKLYATMNETITYTIVVPNTGGLDAVNVQLIDTIPSGTTYITNTLKVNGTIYSNFSGLLNVGTITAGTTTTIQFSVKVG